MLSGIQKNKLPKNDYLETIGKTDFKKCKVISEKTI